MAPVSEVIVDRKVLAGFKKRALLAYPYEIIEQVIGKLNGRQAIVFAFRELEHEGTNIRINMDDDVNPMTEGDDDHRFTILGTIHTHPQDTVEPSELDWKSMKQDGEHIMGVCAIRKTARRRFVSFAFFNEEREHIQLTVSEEAKAAGATA
jgi:proteasome lid subunit RPN8/RPN11